MTSNYEARDPFINDESESGKPTISRRQALLGAAALVAKAAYVERGPINDWLDEQEARHKQEEAIKQAQHENDVREAEQRVETAGLSGDLDLVNVEPTDKYGFFTAKSHSVRVNFATATTGEVQELVVANGDAKWREVDDGQKEAVELIFDKDKLANKIEELGLDPKPYLNEVREIMLSVKRETLKKFQANEE